MARPYVEGLEDRSHRSPPEVEPASARTCQAQAVGTDRTHAPPFMQFPLQFQVGTLDLLMRFQTL